MLRFACPACDAAWLQRPVKTQVPYRCPKCGSVPTLHGTLPQTALDEIWHLIETHSVAQTTRIAAQHQHTGFGKGEIH